VVSRPRNAFRGPPGALGAEHTAAAESRSSEETLVARSKDGDVAAFEELVRRHSGRLYAVLTRFAGERGAEDALQEALVRAWRSIGRFEGRSSFFTWLYRIAINEAKRRAERGPPSGTLVSGDEEAVGKIRDERSTPHGESEQRELRQSLEEAIRKLPVDYRLPLVLRDIEGLSTEESAAIMELSEPAFKSRLHRARMAVREAIEPLLGE
jgi:RNA polymerase sigma-70 factor (ECF subfamily)